MRIQITSKLTGAVELISRSVTDTHAQWVHDQLGSSSETELQAMLDQLSVDDWYDAAGDHRGQDVCGIEMFRDEARSQAIEELVNTILGEDVGVGGYKDSAAYKLANGDIDATTAGLNAETVEAIRAVGTLEFEEIGR